MLLLALAFAAPVAAPSGATLYRTHCATCHGPDAKGDGPLAEHLRFQPPDLTRLASRNGGKFPTDTVSRIIDGRSPVKGHGGPEMPIWGDAFKDSRERYDEKAVKERIARIVRYLASLQH
jgi:mono/diheme cytochrome c family protein